MTQARILPGGTSASRSAASNCGMTLEQDLRLEYRYRLADDPHAGQGLAAEFKLDLDPSGPMQRVSLDAGEARALAAAPDTPRAARGRCRSLDPRRCRAPGRTCATRSGGPPRPA